MTRYPDGVVRYPANYRRESEGEWEHVFSTADFMTRYRRLVKVVVDESDPFYMREAIREDRHGIICVTIEGDAKYAVWGSFVLLEAKYHKYDFPLDENHEVVMGGASIYDGTDGIRYKKL